MRAGNVQGHGVLEVEWIRGQLVSRGTRFVRLLRPTSALRRDAGSTDKKVANLVPPGGEPQIHKEQMTVASFLSYLIHLRHLLN